MLQLTIHQTFDLAVRHHQSGQLQQAESLYRQILAQQPDHPETLHLLGVLAYQVGRNDMAGDLIRRAIAARPGFAEAHGNLAIVLHEQRRLDEAIAAYRQAIALAPQIAESHNGLGNALKDKGQVDEAIIAYHRAIAIKADFFDAYNNLGVALRDKGQLDEAIKAFRQALALNAAHAAVHYNLGNAFSDRGQLEEAAAAFRQAIILKPDFPEAYNNLGNLLRDQGQADEAIAAFRRAIALAPNYAQAHCNLGSGLRDRGKLDEAIAALRQAIALSPGFPEAHNNLATALRDKGLLDEAIAEYTATIRLRPDDAVVHLNLGNALSNRGQHDAAIAAHRQAIALKPDYPEAYSNLGNALADKGRLAEAIAAHRQAIALNPRYAEGHSNLGNALSSKRQFEEAVACYRQAISLNPGLPAIHNNLGIALFNLGRFDEATDCFRRALAISPDGRFYLGLVSTGRQVADPAEAERLAALVQQGGLPVEERIDAEFALGQLLDEAECFDDAFAHFAMGNRLFKESRAAAGEAFDGDGLQRQVDGAIQTFTQEFFTSRRAWGDGSELPVFIVGMPRSGTSLVEQIAASHPAVFGAGELEEMHDLFAAMTGRENPGPGAGSVSPGAWDAQSIVRASSGYLERLRSAGGGAMRVTDKLPANVFHLGLIAVLFPRARVIFCRRDARDNCLSCYFQKFYKNNILYSYDLMDCGRQYLETERQTAHWLRTLPLRMLEIQYETLVADQEGQSRRLIEFLGLPWDPACLEFHRTQRPVMTASAWQVRQPMYTRSVGRWRHYARHMGPLLEVLEGARSTNGASPGRLSDDGNGEGNGMSIAGQRTRPEEAGEPAAIEGLESQAH